MTSAKTDCGACTVAIGAHTYRDGCKKTDSYDHWDHLRRERFSRFDPSFDHIDVEHYEFESVLFYGAAGGHVVASWCQATGTYKIATIADVADGIASDTRNYIINAAS